MIVSIAQIQDEVADFYGVPRSEMTSPCRVRSIARPRQVAMALAKELTTRSLCFIGRRFGGRDHSTVDFAIKQVTRRAELEGPTKAALAALRERLG
jgi:chromosomal replication initiator protein